MPNPGSPRLTRHPEAQQRLDRTRKRVLARRAEARRREKSITEAVKKYIASWVAITDCETKRDQEIETCQQKIQELKTLADTEIGKHRAQQAVAAAALREQGQSDEDVAELLEITTQQARRLIAAARTAPAAWAPLDTITGRREADSRIATDADEERDYRRQRDNVR
ncbi:hypothetical protein [Nocardia brasiliensis]|uniref:Uncharacterized protein n=1 Tax=Nocardia brasiliensis (strain ATCC 700358 / HUJEG-1) TaxID=1133849 RepID=K0F5R3_NOCB7|nr:hypothetical protein [Nocardia brasiliensis]AFU02786.1 hypothetical protein O3I_024155 [Nocardia brasiliensis ATCC 700358]OCF85527.1 hypothetical protein AW168_35290 [Nocardia brasiliensis]